MLAVQQSSAQASISLQAAIDTAFKNNLSIRNERLNADYLKAITNTAWTIPQTNIAFEYGQINSYYKDNRIVVSQSIKFPTVYARQKEVYTEEWKAGLLKVDVRQRELKTRISQVYYELIYLHEKQNLLRHSDSIYTGFLDKAQQRSRVGESNVLEKTTAETQRGQIAQQLKQLQQDSAIVQLQFKILLNSTTDFVPQQDSLKMSAKVLVDTSLLTQHPILKQLEQQQQATVAKVKFEKSKLLPDLIAGYNNMSMKGTGADDD